LHVSKVVDVVSYYEWSHPRWIPWALRTLRTAWETSLVYLGLQKRATGKYGGKFTFLVEIEEVHEKQRREPKAEVDVVIRLDEQEHQDYRWITEAEIDDCLQGGIGAEQFISTGDLQSIKAGFGKWHETYG